MSDRVFKESKPDLRVSGIWHCFLTSLHHRSTFSCQDVSTSCRSDYDHQNGLHQTHKVIALLGWRVGQIGLVNHGYKILQMLLWYTWIISSCQILPVPFYDWQLVELKVRDIAAKSQVVLYAVPIDCVFASLSVGDPRVVIVDYECEN